MKNRYFLTFLLSLTAFAYAQSQSSCLSFFIDSKSAVEGDTVTLDVHVNGADSLVSMSYALFWNPDELDLASVNYGTALPGLSQVNFNLTPSFTDEGKTAVAWFDSQTFEGVSLPDSTVVFSLQFQVLASEGTYAGVRFGATTTTVIEFTDGTSALLNNYSLLGGGVGVGIPSPAAFGGGCVNWEDCDNGGSLQALVSGEGLSYEWLQGISTVSNSPNLENADPGQYILKVEDTLGSQLHAILQLWPTEAPYISDYTVSPAEGCNGALGSITVSPAGGDGNYTFLWSNGYTTPSPEDLTPGYYGLTLTDGNGCDFSAAYEVGTTDTSSFLTAFSQECTIFPPDSSAVNLTCVVWSGGTPPYTFNWNTGFSETDSLRSILQGAPGNGTYTVTITDAAGCVHLPVPVVVDCLDDNGDEPGDCGFTTSSAYECTVLGDGSSIADVQLVVWDGGTPPYTFEWSTGYTETSNDLSQLPSVPGLGTYAVTITDSDTCTYIPAPVIVDCAALDDEPVLLASSNSASIGEQVCVDIRLNTLIDFKALETMISWDPSLFDFERVEDALLLFVDGQIDSTQLSNGSIGINWSTDLPEGVPMNGDEVLFQLCFEAVGPAGSVGSMELSNSSLLTDLADNPIAIDTENGTVFIEGGAGAVTLSLGNASANTGESVCLPLSVQQFTEVSSMQFSIEWDPALLNFEEIQVGDLPGVSTTSGVNYSVIEEGEMSFLWFDPQSNVSSLPDGAVLFYICFTTGDAPAAASVTFSNDPTPIEINDLQDNLPVQLNPGSIYIQQGDVWPGDTDVSQTVSPGDLLNIGLAYGAIGPFRPGASIDWGPQPAEVWGQRTPVSQIDYKQIDTNGDGFIDGLDTLAIVQNMGESNNFLPMEEGQIFRNSTTPLYVKGTDSLQLGEQVVLDIILGESSLPANEVYGLAFTIVYDSSMVVANSTHASFNSSWLGDVNGNMITLQRNRPDDSRIDIALTRINGLNESGSGAIGQLHITIQDVIFMRTEEHLLELKMENVRIISVDEEAIPVTTPPTTTTVVETPVSTFEYVQDQNITVFPVPAKHQLWIRSESPIERITLLSTDGRTMLQTSTADRLDISNLPAGWYTLRILTKQGLANRLVLIQ